MPTIRIFTEGIADKRFLEEYAGHIAPNFKTTEKTIQAAGGWTNIDSKTKEGESIRNQMRINTDNDGINLVIFDADEDFRNRRQEIENWKSKYDLSFELFLLPDNQNSGALEDLLERIITSNNRPIFDCWNAFENCLQGCASKSIERRLTIPAKKTKIYAYLEVLLGETKKEKEKIKEKERDYNNKEHWDLNSDYLSPLKNFLLKNIDDCDTVQHSPS